LLFASQLRFMEELTWRVAFSRALGECVPWVILSPGIFWITARFPIRPGRIGLSLLVSVVVCVGSIWVAEQFFQAVDLRNLPTEPAAERPPGGELGRPPGEGER